MFNAMRFDEDPVTRQCKKTEKENGLRVSNFALFVVIFMVTSGQ